MKIHLPSGNRGLSLVETVISMGLLFVAGVAVVASIIYTRHMMEINKQTLTAMNYARQVLEGASVNGATIDGHEEVLIQHFNAPGTEIRATATLRYYKIENNGHIDWTTYTTTAEPNRPFYCRAIVRWNSLGSMGRERNVTMSTVVRAGTL